MANTNQYTKGPWVALRSERSPEWFINEQRGPGYACSVPWYSHRAAECDANAHLIAAAPELLEACLAMVAWDDAEKSAKPYDEDGGAGFFGRIALCAEAFDKARAAIAKALPPAPQES